MQSKDVIEQAVREAINLLSELPGIEFKSSGPFNKLKYAIAKAAQGISNTRDGGYIIVGVKQKQGAPTILQGVDQGIVRTFDPESVRELVNRFASPAIEVQTVTVTHVDKTNVEKTFIAIAVPPFSRTPTVCRSDTPSSGVYKEDEMRRGDVYIRPLDKI